MNLKNWILDRMGLSSSEWREKNAEFIQEEKDAIRRALEPSDKLFDSVNAEDDYFNEAATGLSPEELHAVRGDIRRFKHKSLYHHIYKYFNLGYGVETVLSINRHRTNSCKQSTDNNETTESRREEVFRDDFRSLNLRILRLKRQEDISLRPEIEELRAVQKDGQPEQIYCLRYMAEYKTGENHLDADELRLELNASGWDNPYHHAEVERVRGQRPELASDGIALYRAHIYASRSFEDLAKQERILTEELDGLSIDD